MLFVVVETICGRHGNDVIHMHYKVSSPCVLLLTSDDVILKKSARGYLSFNQSLVVMETMKYTRTVCCFVFELWVLNLKKEKKMMNNFPYHL